MPTFKVRLPELHIRESRQLRLMSLASLNNVRRQGCASFPLFSEIRYGLAKSGAFTRFDLGEIKSASSTPARAQPVGPESSPVMKRHNIVTQFLQKRLNRKPCTPFASEYDPTTSPLALIPMAAVAEAPGTSMVVNAPPLIRKP